MEWSSEEAAARQVGRDAPGINTLLAVIRKATERAIVMHKGDPQRLPGDRRLAELQTSPLHAQYSIMTW
jgi:hypothetical protein